MVWAYVERRNDDDIVGKIGETRVEGKTVDGVGQRRSGSKF